MNTLKKINAFIINRNLVSTLKSTIDFLKQDNRIQIIVLDQNSDYPELLEYYKHIQDEVIIYKYNFNEGPHSVWDQRVCYLHNDNPFILAYSDCTYDNVPDNWLDIMLNILNTTNYFKVGFSLSLDDLPKTEMLDRILATETQYWKNKCDRGWIAHIDTTFALYRSHSGFSYDGLRLDKPYTIKHIPWYLTKNNVTKEWLYYVNNVTGVSTWGSILKNILQ
jgi:hypothetical protein